MTPEERARRALEPVILYSQRAAVEGLVAAAIREAVEEEREACARAMDALADEESTYECRVHYEAAADAIRARATQEAAP